LFIQDVKWKLFFNRRVQVINKKPEVRIYNPQPIQTYFGIFRKKVFKRPHTTTRKGALFFKINI